jgi:hypothetical protein
LLLLNNTIKWLCTETFPLPFFDPVCYAAILYPNGTVLAKAQWNGYTGDWHNISFNTSFTLYANQTYNYTIVTGSYQQIIQEQSHNATGGVITCSEFVDVNGQRHVEWIPAVRLE